MSDAIREKVVAKLQEIGGGSAIAFELDVDKYFDVMSALLRRIRSCEEIELHLYHCLNSLDNSD